MASTSAHKVEDAQQGVGEHGHAGQTEHSSSHASHLGHDYAAANQKHWNEASSSYRTQGPGAFMAAKAAAAIRQAYDFDAKSTVALDFACGPGLLSEVIAQDTKVVIGADSSEKMVQEYQKTAAQLGLDENRMRAIHVGTLVGAPEELDNIAFDVIFCVNSFHHITDVAATTAALASHLKPGGRLLIVDIDASTGVFEKILASTHHAHSHVPHMAGFTQDQLRGLFEGIDILTDVHVKVAYSLSLSELRENSGTSWNWLHTEEAKAYEAQGKRFNALLASATRTA